MSAANGTFQNSEPPCPYPFKAAGVRLLKTELKVALTRTQIASRAEENTERRRRNQANARTAYDRVVVLRRWLDDKGANELNEKLAELRSRLEQLGERFGDSNRSASVSRQNGTDEPLHAGNGRQTSPQSVKNQQPSVAGEMVASVAHELKNAIGTALDVVYLTRMRNDMPAEAQQRLGIVEQEMHRAAQLTRGTLNYFRPSHPVETKLAELIEDILRVQQARLLKAGVELKKRVVAGEPILTAAEDLRHVFTNLIQNATDAMAGQTNRKLAVRLHRARNWAAERDGYRVVIADNGPGVGREARDKLFQPFYTSKGERGTGLGLWIAKELVHKNGGKIAFRSRSSGATGTVFTVWLPLRADSAQESSPEADLLRSSTRTLP